jgi:hypothetical protein
MAFIVLPLILVFPFALVYIASHRSKSPMASSIRSPLIMAYRSRRISQYGAACQMFRRLLLVVVSTFTLVPETVGPSFASLHHHLLISGIVCWDNSVRSYFKSYY